MDPRSQAKVATDVLAFSDANLLSGQPYELFMVVFYDSSFVIARKLQNLLV